MAGRLPSNRTGYCWHLQVLISSIVLVQVIIMTDRLKFSATDAAKAVNQLMKLDSRDSEALLEVLEEYFHPPRGQDLDSDVDSDVDSEEDPTSSPPAISIDPSPVDTVPVEEITTSPVDEGAL